MNQADSAQGWIEAFAQNPYGLSGTDFPPGVMLRYYRCDEIIAVYGAWGNPGVDPAVDKALAEMCGPPFVRYPSSP
ncbi:MAG: hypothetical protein U0350_17260 [Caldilineaceae bacterium]